MENKIEQEIAQLTKQIEEKRRLLESEKGIVEEKETVRQAVAEKISETVPSFASQSKTAGKTAQPASGSSYLDSADEETTEVVNGLLSTVFSKGIEAGVKEAENYDAYIMDAFHDALTDKVYDQLKSQGLIK